MRLIEAIATHTLKSIYEVFSVSLLLAFLFMFAFLFARDRGAKGALRAWWRSFREDRHFRRVFFLALYTAMILCKTLFCRPIWDDPFRDVLGVWGIRDRDGALYTENIENLALFLPFTFLFFLAFGEKLREARGEGAGAFLRVGALISLGLSVGIETLQLLLRMGAIQLSDVVFNTLGGALGCLLFWLFRRRLLPGKADRPDAAPAEK